MAACEQQTKLITLGLEVETLVLCIEIKTQLRPTRPQLPMFPSSHYDVCTYITETYIHRPECCLTKAKP